MTTEQMDWLDDERAGRHQPPVQGEQPKGGAGNSGAAEDTRRAYEGGDGEPITSADYFRRPDRTVHPNWIVLEDGSVIDGATGQPVPSLGDDEPGRYDPSEVMSYLDRVDNSSVVQISAGALRVLAQRAARVLGEPDADVREHGEWDKEQQRYADGCKSGAPAHEYFDGEGDDPVSETWTGQVEEPIEDRLQRSWLNGFVEGIRRVSYGLPWDHSS